MVMRDGYAHTGGKGLAGGDDRAGGAARRGRLENASSANAEV